MLEPVVARYGRADDPGLIKSKSWQRLRRHAGALFIFALCVGCVRGWGIPAQSETATPGPAESSLMMLVQKISVAERYIEPKKRRLAAEQVLLLSGQFDGGLNAWPRKFPTVSADDGRWQTWNAYKIVWFSRKIGNDLPASVQSNRERRGSPEVVKFKANDQTILPRHTLDENASLGEILRCGWSGKSDKSRGTRRSDYGQFHPDGGFRIQESGVSTFGRDAHVFPRELPFSFGVIGLPPFGGSGEIELFRAGLPQAVSRVPESEGENADGDRGERHEGITVPLKKIKPIEQKIRDHMVDAAIFFGGLLLIFAGYLHVSREESREDRRRPSYRQPGRDGR